MKRIHIMRLMTVIALVRSPYLVGIFDVLILMIGNITISFAEIELFALIFGMLYFFCNP